MSDDEIAYDFDVAVSFAGEDREYVDEVVGLLRETVRVFYDEDFQVESWGEDGVEYFSNVYMKRSRFVLMFVSASYAKKMWTRIERRAAISRAATQRSAYVLPVRLDDTELDGLLPTVLYLDLRKMGVSALAKAVLAKIDPSVTRDAEPVVLANAGKVPRTRAEVAKLLTERTGVWEYLLYAGLLKMNLQELEPKYRDFKIGYARQSGRKVSLDELVSFARDAIGSVNEIVRNFNYVLSPEAQEQAFGAPGEPGDPDRILHIAQRFVSIYEEILDWAADLRGTNGGEGNKALRALSMSADMPIEQCRAFVDDFVLEMDAVSEKIRLNEKVELSMKLTLDVDQEILDQFLREIEDLLG